MRLPTANPFAWHAAALRGDSPPIHGDEPQPGYYKTRLVKGAVFVAVRIWLVSDVDEVGQLVADEELFCEVNGQPQDPFEVWTFCAARPIDKDEFDYMVAVADWSLVNAPREPQANPRRKIDWLTVRPPEFQRKGAT